MPAADQGRAHVVLGAAGATGAAIVTELLSRGLPVRSVVRRPQTGSREGVEERLADLADPEATSRAVEGAAVIYHAANPPYHRWSKEFPALNRSIIAAAERAGARLVFADNLYAYGPGAEAMTEQTPQRAGDRKGRLRASLADELLAAHAGWHAVGRNRSLARLLRTRWPQLVSGRHALRGRHRRQDDPLDRRSGCAPQRHLPA